MKSLIVVLSIGLGLGLALGCLATRSPDAVTGLIARGREALEAGRPADAQKLFEAAAEKEKGSLRTRTWVLRSWMDQGRINDSLDAIDELSKTGAQGVEVDYLYGMAFAAKARGYMATKVATGPVQMALEDAVQFLDRAVKADPELARDAFLPLAEAAWYCGKLEDARRAAETAVRRQPKNGEAQFMLGRVALSQFSAAKADAARKPEADAHWETARRALGDAVAILGTEPAKLDTLVRAHIDLGHTYVWKEKMAEAQAEYASAMTRKPGLVDMGQVHRALGGERFLAAVEAAAPVLAARPEADATDIASLTWWLGWARYGQKQYEKADEAFSAAVAKEPTFINSWFFIALSRFHLEDHEGALGAIRRHWRENPSDLVTAVASDPDANIPVVDSLIAWAAGQQRNADAAFLSEIECEVYPNESRYWNNAGLFWREAGDALRKSEDPEAKKQAPEAFEKAWGAYAKALEIEPESPALLNDAAVVLHYYLERDLARAGEMYKQAIERAKIELAKPDLAAAERELCETALRDSTENLQKLEKGEK